MRSTAKYQHLFSVLVTILLLSGAPLLPGSDVAAQGNVASEQQVIWNEIEGGDHAGADWVITGTTTIAGVHTNVGNFVIPLGVTVSVKPLVKTSAGEQYGFVEIYAKNVLINGSITATNAGYLAANKAGYMGGAGGAGAGSGEVYCGRSGYPGAPGSGPYAGVPGAGGKGRLESEPCPNFNGGAGGNGTDGGYIAFGQNGETLPVLDTDDVFKGSGGGGGGGGAAGSREGDNLNYPAGTGGGGGAGGPGGGYIKLVAAMGDVTVFGRIEAKGGTAGNGGNGEPTVSDDQVRCTDRYWNPAGGKGGNPLAPGDSLGGKGRKATYPCPRPPTPGRTNTRGGDGGNGGAGAGGGILLKGVNINLTGATIDNLGGRNQAVNGGTLKIRYSGSYTAGTYQTGKLSEVDTTPCDNECWLRTAIRNANSTPGPNTINVPTGIYTLTMIGANEDSSQTGDLDITDELTIVGTGRDSTIIDGKGADRVFHIVNPVKVTLVNLTIRNGLTANGAGILNKGALLLDNVTLSKNYSTQNGGGIVNDGGSLTVRNGTILQENAAVNGGAIFNVGQGTVTVDSSFVRQNSAAIGAGFVNESVSGVVTIVKTEFSGNTSTQDGGAIYNQGLLTVNNSTFSANKAIGGGGILNWAQGRSDISNTLFKENKSDNGGAIENGANGFVKLTNSTLSANSAVYFGGGIVNYDNATVELHNATLANNSAATGGGLNNVGSGVIKSEQSIIANSPKGNNCVGTISAQGYNLDSDGSCNFIGGGDQSRVDPLLLPLQDNGGPTWTHALNPLSKAIDAGNPSACLATDQRGQSRPTDGNGDGIKTCDIGAFESPTVPLKIVSIIITKDALPDSPRNFHYYGPWADFYLDDPGEDDGDTIKNSLRYSEVTALGTYSFSEEKVANWFLDDVKCNSTANVTVNKLQRSVTITPTSEPRVVCNFINKYAASLTVLPYWDMDQDGQHDPSEDWQDGWWTEFYDSSGTLKASNFTQNGGHWDLYNIRPGTYTVCQKSQEGWYNTQPILTDPIHKNWPCYTFELSYAQQAKLYFGYSDEPFVASANAQSAAEGVEIIQVSDPEQDALSTWEEFLAVHPGDRLPDEDEVKSNLFLPLLSR